MNHSEIKKIENQNHVQVYKRHELTLVSGKGCKVYDDNGKEYIDALAGIAVNSLGHSHPALVETIAEQSKKLMHVSNLYYTEPQSKLAELLVEKSGLDRAFFCNSGAEAMEAAIKIARKYANNKGKKGNIVSLENCFHGRTIGTISLGKEKYQNGFGPMPEGFSKVERSDIEALKKEFDKGVIAVVIEPILGEGGIYVNDPEFLQAARDLCDKHDALLIFDEIQCGIGRTGKLFAYDNYGIKPDIVTLAKALGSGFPIGAAIMKQKAADALNPGEHGTTFGGNPLACAVGYTALSTIINEKLPEQAGQKGEYFINKIREKTKDIKEVKEVRGMGLMIGVELEFPCGDVVNTMINKGVLANCAAQYTIRIVPPLIITYDEIDKVVEVMLDSILENINGK
jgi:acetylornithine/N-succinyldiaminopimelate aminotransferase